MGYSEEFAAELEETNAKAASLRSISDEELDLRFGFSKVTPEGTELIIKTRQKFNDLAWFVDAYLPPGRAKSVALTDLETASMWAVKAIVSGHRLEPETSQE